jgi:hypothetical protein
MWPLYSPNGRNTTSVSACPAGFLDKVDSCEGYEKSGFQNSGSYYFIARGQPRVKDCKAIQESRLGEVFKPVTKVDVPELSAWHHDNCSLFPNLKNGKCFSLDILATNGNTHYYLMAAFSDDCQTALFFPALGMK